MLPHPGKIHLNSVYVGICTYKLPTEPQWLVLLLVHGLQIDHRGAAVVRGNGCSCTGAHAV